MISDFSTSSSILLHFAGFRYWTTSLPPALVGTTLPFWLNPPGFSFRWIAATGIAFLLVRGLFPNLHPMMSRWDEY